MSGKTTYKTTPKTKRFVWTWEADRFLLQNYRMCSDAKIAEALGCTKGSVSHRRKVLGCTKGYRGTSTDIIMWCNREDFERDCMDYNIVPMGIA